MGVFVSGGESWGFELSENLYIYRCVCGGEGVSVAQEARLGVFKGNHIYIH